MEEFQEFAQRSCSTVRATSHSFMISLPPPHHQFVCIPFLGLELEDIPSVVVICDLILVLLSGGDNWIVEKKTLNRYSEVPHPKV